jgi:hypothetical protein
LKRTKIKLEKSNRKYSCGSIYTDDFIDQGERSKRDRCQAINISGHQN